MKKMRSWKQAVSVLLCAGMILSHTALTAFSDPEAGFEEQQTYTAETELEQTVTELAEESEVVTAAEETVVETEETVAETEMAMETETESEETVTESEAETETENVTESEAETETENVTESETETESETMTETEETVTEAEETELLITEIVEEVSQEYAAGPLTNVELTINTDLLLAGAVYSAATHGTDGCTVTGVTGGISVADCKVESITWEDYNRFPLSEGVRLDDGNDYWVKILLEVPDGSFTNYSNVSVKVNGTVAETVDDYDKNENGLNDRLQLDWKFLPEVKGTIDQISLTGVPEASAGAPVLDYSYADTMYRVTGKWEMWNAAAQSFEPVTAASVFENGKIYRLVLEVVTEAGYPLSEAGVSVYLNENDCTDKLTASSAYSATIVCDFPLGLESINKVVIGKDAIPELVAGQTFSDTVIQVPVLDERYTVSGNWVDENGNSEGTFTKGKAYSFCYTVTAKEGYCFEEHVEVQEGEIWNWYYAESAAFTGAIRKSLKTPISEVVLTNVPEAKLGDTLPAEEFSLTVPAGAKYKATAQWRNPDGTSLLETVTVKKGEVYEFWIDLSAEDGYEFASDYLLRINGSNQMRVGGGENDSYYRTYSFRDQIDQIEVTGVIEPMIGAAASVDTLRVPDGANYEIAEAKWRDERTGVATTQFEDGHAYCLEVRIAVKEGYEFASNIKWKIGNSSGKTVTGSLTEEWFWTDVYSFEKVIPRVEIDHVPTRKVGETVKTDVRVPENANYKAVAEWSVWDEETKRYVSFSSGVFEEGKTYVLHLRAEAEEGYCFEKENLEYYLNGKKCKPEHVMRNMVVYSVNYQAETDQVIKQVEVTVDKPVTGDDASMIPVVTVPEDAAYYLQNDGSAGRESHWIENNDGDKVPFSGYFEESGDYGVRFSLIAKEGYVFSEKLIVLVNGINVSINTLQNRVKEVYVDYLFSMVNPDAEGERPGGAGGSSSADPDPEDTASKDEISAEKKEPETSAGATTTNNSVYSSPDTGDDSQTGVLFSMMGGSMAAMLAVLYLWKRRMGQAE